MRNTPVRTIMTTEVITVTRHLTADAALEIMLSEGVKRLPVVSAETGRVIGIISRSDARTALLTARLERAESPTVDEAMTSYVHTVAPDDTIAHSIDLMVNQNISGLPVVDDKNLVGIVTAYDILTLVARTDPVLSG